MTSDEPGAGSASLRGVLETCDLGPLAARPSREERKVPTLGQMSEEAARAKRLYDAEKWPDALKALQRVAGGAAGDDEGNRQIADYHVAIALYRLQRVADSAKAFEAIARNRDHVKNRETMIWLAKIADERPELLDPSDFDLYTREDISRFDNPNQREVYGDLAFLVGRARMRSRELGEAEQLLIAVPANSRFGARAQECLSVVRHAHRE